MLSQTWFHSADPLPPTQTTTWTNVLGEWSSQQQGNHGRGEIGSLMGKHEGIELGKRWPWLWEWHFLSFLSNMITTTHVPYLTRCNLESLKTILAATFHWHLKGKHLLTSIAWAIKWGKSWLLSFLRFCFEKQRIGRLALVIYNIPQFNFCPSSFKKLSDYKGSLATVFVKWIVLSCRKLCSRGLPPLPVAGNM